jgi:hypothetical protein
MIRIVGALSVLTWVAPPLLAEPLRLSGELASRFSDNTTLVPDNEESDVETRASIRVSHQTDPGQCAASTFGDFGYGVWHEKTYDPETYTTLDFVGDCELARGLRWQLADNLRDVRQDTSRSGTPDNTTQKNVFRTGPVYTLNVTQVDELDASAQFEDTRFGDSEEIDSERYIGSVGWTRRFSPTFAGGLRYTAEQADFAGRAEIRTDIASLEFNQIWATTTLSGSVGVSEVESDFGSGSQTSDGFVGELRAVREINPFTEVYLEASRELTDQASDFDVRFGEFEFNLLEVDVIEVTSVVVGLRRDFSDASRLDLSVFSNRADYLTSGFSEDRTGLSVGYRRPMSAQLFLETGLDYEWQELEFSGVDDETVRVFAGMSYQFTEDLAAAARLGHGTRSGEPERTEYRENWLSVSLNYQFF